MKKNQDNKIKISVVGLGYVGLPLVNEFGKYFKTIGYDKNPKRIKELRNDIDINNETTLNNSKRKLNCRPLIVSGHCRRLLLRRS